MCAVALAAARLADYRRSEAWAYLQSGLIALDSHEVEKAETLASHARRLFVGLDDLVGEALVLGVQGEALFARGIPGLARRVFDEALNRFQDIGYHRGRGWVLRRIAAVDLAYGDRAGCWAVLNDALTAFGEAQDHWSMADTLVRRGEVLHQLGSFGQARRSWRLALHFYEQVGDRRAYAVADQLATLQDLDDHNGSDVG